MRPAEVAELASGDPEQVTIANARTIDLNLGLGDDVVNVAVGPAAVTVNGNGGNDRVNVTLSGSPAAVTPFDATKYAVTAKAEEIRVRNLLNHTNGIDGDFFWPDEVKGRNALKYYVAQLGAHCGTRVDPGEYVSYSNAGMLVAGRLLELPQHRQHVEP